MDTKKATSREVQRSIFSDNLFRELEAMESAAGSRNADLVAKATEYKADGLQSDEIVDMLILDGFPAKLCRDYVEIGKTASVESAEEWDFLYEDAHGKIWRGSQLDMTVAGASKKEAMQAARALVASGDIQLERIIDAERIQKD